MQLTILLMFATGLFMGWVIGKGLAKKDAADEILALREFCLNTTEINNAYRTRFPGSRPNLSERQVKEAILNAIVLVSNGDYEVVDSVDSHLPKTNIADFVGKK